MPGVVNVGKNAMDVRKSVAMLPYSRVIITVDEDTEYEAGNTSGETLEFECPWGTQQMANDILAKIRGYQYQPYTVDTAIVEPSAEIGDAVQANGVYGGMYQQDSTFGSTFYSDFSAPSDEQLDHEFTYVSPTERRITRQKLWSKAEFSITNEAIAAEVSQREADSREFRGNFEVQAREIAARVTQTGGSNSSFGWSLVSNAFTLYSGNKAVFTCNSGGVNVDGKITARSGYIGNGSTGFTIGNTNIQNGMTSLADTSHDGVYLGTDGVALGRGKFKVTRAGALTATSATITGKVTATSGYIGNGTSGFEIGNTFIRNGVTSMSDSSHDGIYLGTNGVRLGKGVFSVNSAGKLTASDVDISGKITATSGTFTGTVNATSGYFDGTVYANRLSFRDRNGNTVTISAANLTDGTISSGKLGNGSVTEGKLGAGSVTGGKIGDGAVTEGKIGGGAVTEGKIGSGAVTGGKIGNKAVSKGKTSDNVQTSLNNGDTALDNYNKLTSGTIIAGRLKTGALVINDGRGGWDLSIGSHTMKFVTITVSGSTYHVLGY